MLEGFMWENRCLWLVFSRQLIPRKAAAIALRYKYIHLYSFLFSFLSSSSTQPFHFLSVNDFGEQNTGGIL